MKLSFTIKSFGKKRPYLGNTLLELDITPEISMKELLKEIVINQVALFNDRKKSKDLLTFLNEEKMEILASSGAITFNEQYNTTEAATETAIEAVLQAFEDGLIAFFINDEKIETIDEAINLQEEASITIIKLTFLTGALW